MSLTSPAPGARGGGRCDRTGTDGAGRATARPSGGSVGRHGRGIGGGSGGDVVVGTGAGRWPRGGLTRCGAGGGCGGDIDGTGAGRWRRGGLAIAVASASATNAR